MKIKIQPAFFVYIGVNAFFSSMKNCAAVLVALLVHELGHYIAARCIGERIDSVEMTPFGGVMTCSRDASASKGLRGLALASAGPLGNYLCIQAASMPSIQYALGAEWIKALTASNMVMLVLNLTPALPFDGGRIVFSIGYYCVSLAPLITVLTALGIAVGAAFCVLSVYGYFAYGIINCSIILIGIYVIVCAARSRSVLLAENLIAVVQERLSGMEEIRQMKLIRIGNEVCLHELLEPMQRAEECCFVYKNKRDELCFIEEREVLKAMLRTPSIQISQVEGGFSLKPWQ